MDLWSEASYDFDAERRARSLEMAKAASQGTWAFLALAQSFDEYKDRVALASNQIMTTAAANGVDMTELINLFDQRFALLMEAKAGGDNPFDDDSDDDTDTSDTDTDDDGEDDDSDSDDDNDGTPDDEDSDSDGDGDDDSSDEGDTDDDGGEDDDSDGKDSAPPWANKYAALASAIQSGADPLEWGGTPFAHSSARKQAADGAPDQVTDVSTPQPDAAAMPGVPGMNGGIAETTKPRQLPEGGGMDPTMAPGMGMDGIGEPGSDAPFDPATNGGDIQQGADDLPPADDSKMAKIKAIAAEVQKYNPTLSPAQCRKVASRVYSQYLHKHAEDMNPLLFGDRGSATDGPVTDAVKKWSPADLKPGKKGDGKEDEGGGLPPILPKLPELPGGPKLLELPGGAAAAGEGEAAVAGAARLLPLLAL